MIFRKNMKQKRERELPESKKTHLLSFVGCVVEPYQDNYL